MARLALLISAALSVAGALRVPSAERGPATAVCIAGNARTLPRSDVAAGLERFVKRQEGSSLVGLEHPDVYAYITLEGAQPKGQEGWNFVAENVSRMAAEGALRAVQPVASMLVDDADEVTPENLDEYILNRRECFTNGFFKKLPQLMRRTMNQLVHFQRCMDLVVEKEKELDRQYEVVIISRPDISYSPATLDLKAVAQGTFLCQKDWVMVFPRKVAGLLLAERARPLSCQVGQPCCGHVGQSEVLWEYLLGVRPDNRGSCHCGPSLEETGPLIQKTDQNIGRIARPEKLDD